MPPEPDRIRPNVDHKPEPARHWRRWLRPFVLILAAAAVTVVSNAGSIPTCDALKSGLAATGIGAPLVFFALYALATILLVPGVLITAMAGLLYGPWAGTLLAVTAANAGAVLMFAIARWALRDTATGLLGSKPWFQAMRRQAEGGGIRFVALMRLIPVVPFNVLNFACGILPVSAASFAVGSVLGMVPGAYAFATFGQSGCQVIDGLRTGTLRAADLPAETLWNLLTASAVLVLLMVAPWLRRRLGSRPNRPSQL